MNATSKPATVTVEVRRHYDAAKVGEIKMPVAEWELYAECRHPAFEWPSGLADAGDWLDDEQIEAAGIKATTTIYLED